MKNEKPHGFSPVLAQHHTGHIEQKKTIKIGESNSTTGLLTYLKHFRKPESLALVLGILE